jgi:hypothetical protein
MHASSSTINPCQLFLSSHQQAQHAQRC